MEIADEQIDTIGRAILAQTLGCARCHDHKFDPIPTADYYALAGILTSTRVMEQRHMLNQQRVMERLVGIGPDGEALDAAYEKYWVDRDDLNKKTQRAKSVLALLKKGDEQALKNLLEKTADVVAQSAADTTQPMEKRIEAQQALIAQLDASIGKPPDIPPRAMVPTDGEAPSDEHIRLAGEFDELGDEVSRGFLQVICTNADPEIPDGQSGRLELGHWLTDVDDGAGRLAARVLANRIWHQLFGQGLVRTVDNFGRTGETPSHPRLLDYLAQELIDSGWSVKALVRQIVLSRANALSSAYDEAAFTLDPENRLHWRFPRRRLDPEALRDAMLAAAGQLDLAPMDSTVWYLMDQATSVGNFPRRRTDFPCRTVYLPVIRNDLPEIFEVFDFADPHLTTGRRPTTTVATQGLFMLNADLVMDAAEGAARRLLSDTPTAEPAERVQLIFERILITPPSADELQQVLAFIAETEGQLAAAGDEEPAVHAWAMACHALFASSRFQYVE
jgi:hypothetical protein